MQKTKELLRAKLLFLCGVVSRIFRSSPGFKRFARFVLHHVPIVARFYAQLITSPAPPPRKHILTSQASIIYSDLKAAISQIESRAEKKPPFKGG